ncbi:hypothetical protein OIU74_025445 [Salix koriyanagi]|uniref:Pentatricopeptide repeat-containing protein n=1 Tax=Salix koriyanagi TaxID=2511006 RepID=A0A9Q1A596_9ROSI|nr:hypothetical protein OIU74_025445 [Salix koriyanagi]
MFDEISHTCIVEYNAMLDAYAKNGDVGSACFLLKSMPKRDVVSWTSVISGFAKNGFFGEAIRLFREMMLRDDANCGFVKPNEATYVSVLSSCANLDERGVLCMGKQIHGYIGRNEARVTVFIGTALIDFYGKVGCLSNAIKVYNQMVVKKICTWNAIISSLANNGMEEQALDTFKKMKEEVGSRLLELQPHHCGQYVALSSIHAGVDRWGAAADIRTTMTEARIRKVPACSLIDCM